MKGLLCTYRDPGGIYLILRGKQAHMMNTPLESVNLTADDIAASTHADVGEHEGEESHASIHMPNGSLWPLYLSVDTDIHVYNRENYLVRPIQTANSMIILVIRVYSQV